MITGKCWSCAKELEEMDYGRQSQCPQCGRDTRVCKGCIHYDASYHNSCREPQADRVLEKERSNFCDYFKPSQVQTGSNPADAAKAAAEALFKKK